ncbi:TetR/AcrR family transcriptional regulator [Altererythrobacter indicus]|uniref:TetR/AcrR family transcriptional regulator n=1 Tax=Altericroceibacterium indicum TaxID=374177 RepID=A0A845ABN6_9SPHN|nr:TetR/AcrR family transcriptional regulator [Altericroceibacterium indicum]MXP26917.1 TetR/AcrR family transcriptional regulator [Altericroceibacterium indicum]
MTDAPPRKPGRPSRLSREKIARAALDIGLDRVTLTSLATRLGADHSSLYRHVTGREEIIALAAQIAVEELDWRAPEATGWRDELVILTDALWALYEHNPGLAQAVHRGEITPQAGMRSFAESVARLQTKGFPLDEALMAVDMLVDMVGECFLGWWSISTTDDDGRQQRQRMIDLWEAQADEAPDYREQLMGMSAIMHAGRRQWWENKRDLVLEGIAATRARNAALDDTAAGDL